MLNTKLIHDFVAYWGACEHTNKKVMYHHGYEKGESQPFWLDNDRAVMAAYGFDTKMSE